MANKSSEERPEQKPQRSRKLERRLKSETRSSPKVYDEGLDERERRRLAEEIIDGVEQVMRIRGMFFREELERHRLTFPQFHLLKMVGLFGDLTVTEASRLMLVAPPTASRMINGLCAKGLLERRVDPHDRRVTRIGLTRRGRTVLRKVNEQQVSAILEMLREEDYAVVRAFASLLDKLIDRWGAEGKIKTPTGGLMPKDALP